MKLSANPPRSRLFPKGKVLPKIFNPLFDKEGQGEIYSASFGETTLARNFVEPR